MKMLVLGAGIILAGAAPASAALQLAIEVGGTTEAFVDNGPGDLNPALGVLEVANRTIDGVVVNGSIQVSTHGPLVSLSASSLMIVNDGSAAVPIAVAVSDTGFSLGGKSPGQFELAGAGTWLSAIGSNISLGWFVDPANAQGASTAADLPGTVVGSFFNSPGSVVDSFSHTAAAELALSGPFSMSLEASGSLSAGASLVNRGQSIASAPIPEASTWVMVVLGLAAMGGIGMRKQGRRFAF